MSARIPEYSAPYKSQKNAIMKLGIDGNRAQKLPDAMKTELAKGEIE